MADICSFYTLLCTNDGNLFLSGTLVGIICGIVLATFYSMVKTAIEQDDTASWETIAIYVALGFVYAVLYTMITFFILTMVELYLRFVFVRLLLLVPICAIFARGVGKLIKKNKT